MRRLLASAAVAATAAHVPTADPPFVASLLPVEYSSAATREGAGLRVSWAKSHEAVASLKT